MRTLLSQLIEKAGPCGFEQEMANFLFKSLENKVDELWIDGLGNVIAKKEGAYPGPTLMLSAHSDEVGFIVKKIEANGLLRFEKLGGHDDRTILCEKVHVHTQKGKLAGVIGCISCHMMRFDDPKKVRGYQQMYIDIGAKDANGAKELGVCVGDPITWATPYQEIGQNRAMGHGFDDKAGCCVVMKALEEVDFSKVHGTVYASFSVQEELGLRGARVASQQLQADVAIAIDTTACSDTFEEMMDNTMCLGDGVGIKVIDHSSVSSLSLRRCLQNIATANEIPYQLEVFAGIGTDAGEMLKEKKGVPTCTLSIPSRYAHTPHEVIDLGDLTYTKDLLVQFIYSMKNKADYAFILGEH